ncbi:MAG TPA: hypothetical protein PKN99_08950 [Cyclobacteriaceae bacterium]|nr:hypothetical protein [Cyclobacteriaceae bacterium]
MKKYLFVFIILFSCSSKSGENRESYKFESLVSEWRNLTLKVELDKKQGRPSSIFEVNENTWEEQLQIRPIRTYFRNDGTFNSEHFNLQDSLVLNPSGSWTATDGEVTMMTTQPFSDTTTCTYTIKGNVVTFGCWVDWDEDGEKDDWYLGTQQKY